jgi:hypothetical protein
VSQDSQADGTEPVNLSRGDARAAQASFCLREGDQQIHERHDQSEDSFCLDSPGSQIARRKAVDCS